MLSLQLPGVCQLVLIVPVHNPAVPPPVPLSEITRGLVILSALWGMLSCAVFAPPVVGVNRTVKVPDSPGAKYKDVGLVIENWLAFAPEIVAVPASRFR